MNSVASTFFKHPHVRNNGIVGNRYLTCNSPCLVTSNFLNLSPPLCPRRAGPGPDWPFARRPEGLRYQTTSKGSTFRSTRAGYFKLQSCKVTQKYVFIHRARQFLVVGCTILCGAFWLDDDVVAVVCLGLCTHSVRNFSITGSNKSFSLTIVMSASRKVLSFVSVIRVFFALVRRSWGGGVWQTI